MTQRTAPPVSSASILVTAWLAGLGLGLGCRVAVVPVAVSTDAFAQPTLLATLDIVLLGTMVGVVAGLPYLFFRTRVRSPAIAAAPPGAAVWHGAVWGAVVFILLALLLPAAIRSVFTNLEPGARALAAAVFAALFCIWGVALEKAVGRLAATDGTQPDEGARL